MRADLASTQKLLAVYTDFIFLGRLQESINIADTETLSLWIDTMFGFFSSKPFEPLDHESRKYLEYNMQWLHREFPDPPIEQRKILTPCDEDFPIFWDGSVESACKATEIIAQQMQIVRDIELGIFVSDRQEVDSEKSALFHIAHTEANQTAGLYHGKTERDTYLISLNVEYLQQPEFMVAVIAHELAHAVLLGEKGLQDNDENLTDVTTVFFGLGVFNANASFRFFKNGKRWGYNRVGYLNQEEWAYSLALFAFMQDNPKMAWTQYLNDTVKKDFERSLDYLLDNEETIFQFEDKDTPPTQQADE